MSSWTSATARTPDAGEAYERFASQYPSYLETSALDLLRSAEYRRLDDGNQVYLDYTGGSLFAESQVREHLDLLRAEVFGNPHSTNPSSAATTNRVESARRAILRYFNADGAYIAAFTANASGALKLAGEAYPFAPGGCFLATFDNHNSVNGIREFARAKGAAVAYAPLTAPDLRIDVPELERLLDQADPACSNLLAFPAQSNFSGVKHPLDLIRRAKAKGWDVLLDAAAFVPTNRLALDAVRPDFVSLSFYKMFGYPTGVGALLIRREILPKLKRPWFAGGTVNFVSVQARRHVLSPDEAGFEDGTLNYLAIPAVEMGLRHLDSIGMDIIGERVRCLTAWLLGEMLAMRHSNGRAMVRIYGPATTDARGGTIAFNLYDPQGHLLDYRRVEEMAAEQGISLRTGCFCNPGAGEAAESLTETEMRSAFQLEESLSLPSFLRFLESSGLNKSAGAIRASLGLVTNFADVWRLVQFLTGLRDQTRIAIGGVSFDIDSCRVIRDGS